MFYILTIFTYMVVLLIVGLLFARRIRSKEDFMVAGRKLGAPVLVGTLLATWIGSGDIFSVADLSYHHGFSSLIGSAGGWLGIILIYFLAARVRRFGQFTVPDILETRYNKWARILATLTTIIAYTTIVSYQFRGGGWVLNLVTGGALSMKTAMIVMAVFTVIYTLTAGMLSVAYLDIINGVVILGGVVLAIPFLIRNAGGLTWISTHVTPRAHPFFGNMEPLQALGYFIPTLLLALGNANMYQRFFSARTEKDARLAVIGWVIGVIFIGFAIQSLAVIGSSLLQGLSVSESGKIILLVATKGLPVAVGCVLMASIVAIIMSTSTSFLLVPATNVMRDIVQRFIAPGISDRSMVMGSRVVLVFLGFCAYGLMGFFPRILEAAYAAYTVYGAGLTPSIIATFFWKRATPSAGVASILGGMSVTVGWETAKRIMGHPPLGLASVYPALCISVLMLVGVSLVQKKPPESKWRPFFKDSDKSSQQSGYS